MAGEHSSAATASFKFPPGFRFHPSDEELIVHYLQNKVTSRPLPASVIAEVDLYKYNPWELPKKALFGEDEWYFFSPRDRKYPNGDRPSRAAGLGYWKATGTDKPILSSFGSKNLGVKKALVFYTGRPPKGVKTGWMMNEYRLLETTIKPSRLKGSMRLDDWVLCRVRLKGNMPKIGSEVHDSHNAEPKTEAALSTYTNQKNEMIADCLYKDCRLLAFILSGQTLPPIETNSSVSCQGSKNDNSFNLTYKYGSDKLNSPLTVSSFGTYFNSLKMKPNDKNRPENLLPSSKKPYGVIIDEDLPPSKTLANNDLGYSSQCQDGIYPNLLDPIIDFQEFNDLALTGKYIQ